jgi:homoserine dehydrogenase
MQQRLGVTIAAVMAAALVHFSPAAMAQGVGHSEVKQIQLTEKQVQGVVAAQKDVAAVFDKLQGPPPDQLPPQILAELDAATKKHGFKDFNDYDEVVGNITMVMTGIDPKTKAFTEPAAAIKKEIADVTADKTISAQEKKQMLEELNEALKAAQPIQFPGNIELVKKYYDKIDAALN